MLIDPITTLTQATPDVSPWDAYVGWLRELPPLARVLAIAILALAAQLAVRLLRAFGEWVVTPAESPRLARNLMERRAPKIATLTGLVVSALTFTIYFLAIGLALRELTPITIGQYLASATIIGLAIGFGTQGLVQDVVTGLTLIFSNAMDIGDIVEVSGQTGRVEKIGLRFTTLTNFVGQVVLVPNRNIAAIGRYRTGYARAFLDVQVPNGVDEAQLAERITGIASAFAAQHPAVIMGRPRVHQIQSAGEEGWRYVRTRFRIWPGQQSLIEGSLRQRVIAAVRELDQSFPDWMVTVTYRIQQPGPQA